MCVATIAVLFVKVVVIVLAEEDVLPLALVFVTPPVLPHAKEIARIGVFPIVILSVAVQPVVILAEQDVTQRVQLYAVHHVL
jgi:hypothetical protein